MIAPSSLDSLPARSEGAPAAGNGTILPLAPARDAEAASILAACTAEGTADRGRELVAAARGDPDGALNGLTVGDELVAVYALRKSGLSLEITQLVVAETHRRRGYGRACLADALRRAGKRPLVVEADDETLGFYQAAGFKLVGKRRQPGGATRYRLGWHAPRGSPVGPIAGGPASSRSSPRLGGSADEGGKGSGGDPEERG